MNIYITRHGQTDFNLQGYWQGCLLNPSLNNYGKEQAKMLADKINKKMRGSYRMICSPLRRAYETGEIISDNLNFAMDINQTPMIKTQLIEGDFGVAEGHTEEELRMMIPDDLSKWKDLDNLDFKFKNGESKREIGERINKQIIQCVNTYIGLTSDIIIITHSAAIRCLLLQYGIKSEEILFGEIFKFTINFESTNFFDSTYNLKFIESF